MIAPFDVAREAAKQIPGARLVRLEDENHWPIAESSSVEGTTGLLQTVANVLAED